MVAVKVIKHAEVDGRAVRPGEMIEVEPVIALVLSRKGIVSLSRQLKASTSSTETRTRKGGRHYRRRDMVAEK